MDVEFPVDDVVVLLFPRIADAAGQAEARRDVEPRLAEPRVAVRFDLGLAPVEPAERVVDERVVVLQIVPVFREVVEAGDPGEGAGYVGAAELHFLGELVGGTRLPIMQEDLRAPSNSRLPKYSMSR